MANVVPVKHIEFKDPTERQTYGMKLKKQIEDALRDRQGYDKMRTDWLKQYDGRMERLDKPAGWQAKVDISTTREAIQAVRARLVNPVIQQDKVMVGQPRKPEFEDFAKQVEAFLDYAFDQFDNQRLFMEMVENAAVYGMGVVKTPFLIERRTVKEWQEVDVPLAPPPGMGGMQEGPPGMGTPPGGEMGMSPGGGMGMPPQGGGMEMGPSPGEMGTQQFLPDMGMLPQTQKQMQETTRTYDERVGVFPLLVPPTDFIYPSTAVELATAKFLSHRVYLDEGTIKSRIKDKEYYPVFDKLQRTGSVDELTKTRETLIGLDIKGDRFDIHEIYTNEDFDKDGIDEDVIITLDYSSGTILRAIYNYYHDFKRPFIVLYWEKRPNSMDGQSLCYVLQNLHRAYTAIICMILDSGTLANKGWFVATTDNQLVDLWKSQNFTMGDALLMNSLPKESTEVFTMGQPQTNLLEVAAIIRDHINILAAINLYNQGQEQIDRPTATGQSLLVEEGKQPLYEKLELVRCAISELALHILARNKQFYQNVVNYNQFVDQQLMPMLLQFPPGLIEDQVLLEPKASSAMLSENTRKQELVALLDRIGASQKTILDFLTQGMQGAAQGLPLGMVAAGFADAYQILLSRMLKEFKVSKIEEINPPVRAMLQVGQFYQQIIMQLQQQVQQQEQQMQQMQGQVQQAEQLAAVATGQHEESADRVRDLDFKNRMMQLKSEGQKMQSQAEKTEQKREK